ncbi:hypothetical protein KFK09_022602 [Dendrobium nobile]|uniref:Reverse transcriptase domain-containing protein n=1 Tax=Dendrobium nobile TaxID=94219 RepID=A0A8T3AJP7_DENNO|nr:hypothetical protein KFK09_022602 [Dendrobium nobile]
MASEDRRPPLAGVPHKIRPPILPPRIVSRLNSESSPPAFGDNALGKEHNFCSMKERPLIISEGGIITKKKTPECIDQVLVEEEVVNKEHEGKDQNTDLITVRKCDYGVLGNCDMISEVAENSKKSGNVIAGSNVWKRKANIKVSELNFGKDFVGEDGVVKLNLEKEVENSNRLNKSLVIKIFGDNTPFHVISLELRRQWGRVGKFHLTQLGLGWVLCAFENPDSLEEIITSGPYYVNGNIVGMDRWNASFSPTSFKGLTAPIWIRLPNLPLQCWDEENVCRIASKVGSPYLIDGNMFQWSRREYARVCVRIKLDEILPLGVWVEGHLKEDCSKNVIPGINAKVNIEKQVTEGILIEDRNRDDTACKEVADNGFNGNENGPWIQVGNKKKKNPGTIHKSQNRSIGGDKISKNRDIVSPSQDKIQNNNKFEALKDLSVEKEINEDLIIPEKLNFNRVNTTEENQNLVLLTNDILKNLGDNSNTAKKKGGDFNCLLAKEEKKGGRRFNMSSGPKDMKSFLISNNLYELKFMGPMFTWSNNKKGLDRIMERLDRMIVNSYSVNNNQLLVVKHLPRIASDHCPILLNLNSSSPKISKTFKFENIWASYPASFSVVQNVWNRKAVGSPSDILNTKMRRTMKTLYFWSRSKHQNLEQLKENLKKEILQLQEKEARNGLLSSDEICLLKFKIGELNSTLARLSTWWKQRAKVKWINEGDQNSKFFHSFASARRNVNFIASIKDELGNLVDKQNEIEEVLIRHFRNKWSDKNCILTDWPENSKCLDNQDILKLSKDFSIDEVEEALKGTSDCTAPGEDGVSYSFFKNYWAIIKSDLWKAIQIFLLTADMNKNWKKTQIVLIPKISNPTYAAHYRPVSLCNTVYKLVAKILLNRINFFIPKLITLEQATFIKGRTLHDHILIAQEVFHKFRHSKASKGLVSIKLDMEQAYDSMGWPTLCKVLDYFGFPISFSKLIMGCVLNPSYAILINGNHSNWIEASSGFRQGCPLSPYLFILCSQLLSNAILEKENIGVRVSSNSPRISHLLYADDAMIFAEAKITNVKVIKEIIKKYCNWTGHKVNTAKSGLLFGKAVNSRIKRKIKNILGYKEQMLLEDRWYSPPPNWIKINVDVALYSSYKGGIGGVVRDYKGRLIAAFGTAHMHWDITFLELLAITSIQEVINKWSNDFKGIIIESENENVIKTIHKALKKGRRGKPNRVFNKRTLVVEENTHVVFDESDPRLEEVIEVTQGFLGGYGRTIINPKTIEDLCLHLEDLNTYSIDNLLGSLIAYEKGVNQRNLDVGERKKEKMVALKANGSDTDFSGKQRHVKSDCPTLRSHLSKEKGEEKPKSKKDKKRFWAYSISDSFETKPEEETPNLCLMTDNNLGQSNQEEVSSHKRPHESMWYLDNGCSQHMTGYSSIGKSFRVFNKRTLVVEETTHVVFNEFDPRKPRVEDDDDGKIATIVENLEKWIEHQNTKRVGEDIWKKYEMDKAKPINTPMTSSVQLDKDPSGKSVDQKYRGNPIQHSRTKHIDIRHHFIRDHVTKGDIELHHVATENQLADIFTKPLAFDTFSTLRTRLGVIDINA